MRRFRYFAALGADRADRSYTGTPSSAWRAAKAHAAQTGSPVHLFGEIELGGEELLGTIQPNGSSKLSKDAQIALAMLVLAREPATLGISTAHGLLSAALPEYGTAERRAAFTAAHAVRPDLTAPGGDGVERPEIIYAGRDNELPDPLGGGDPYRDADKR